MSTTTLEMGPLIKASEILPGDMFEHQVEGLETRPVVYVAVNMVKYHFPDSKIKRTDNELHGVDLRDGRVLCIVDPDLEVRRVMSVKIYK